ncbi:MAG: hypothetical protein KC414_12175, partial [Romboutsia sp.]|nr:hypothetical protein [Romboutsia sp.]
IEIPGFKIVEQSNQRVDYIKDAFVSKNSDVELPVEIFKIWHAMTNNLDFEVGGGIDFNLLKQVERLKLSYGTENAVSFISDFEVAWHTHPGVSAKGDLKLFKPPSPNDIIIGLISNYHFWLIFNNKLAKDLSNTIKLAKFNKHNQQPNTVELNIVTDKSGVYTYKANSPYWHRYWQKNSLSKFKEDLLILKSSLQEKIDQYFIALAEKTISLEQARKELLSALARMSNIDLTYSSWDVVLVSGLKFNLNIVEGKDIF